MVEIIRSLRFHIPLMGSFQHPIKIFGTSVTKDMTYSTITLQALIYMKQYGLLSLPRTYLGNLHQILHIALLKVSTVFSSQLWDISEGISTKPHTNKGALPVSLHHLVMINPSIEKFVLVIRKHFWKLLFHHSQCIITNFSSMHLDICMALTVVTAVRFLYRVNIYRDTGHVRFVKNQTRTFRLRNKHPNY